MHNFINENYLIKSMLLLTLVYHIKNIKINGYPLKLQYTMCLDIILSIMHSSPMMDIMYIIILIIKCIMICHVKVHVFRSDSMKFFE